MSLADTVPTEFYRGDEEKPYAETVGELIAELERLPDDLPVRHGFDHGCKLCVYNIRAEDAHLEVIDADD